MRRVPKLVWIALLPLFGLAIVHVWPDEQPLPDTWLYENLLNPDPASVGSDQDLVARYLALYQANWFRDALPTAYDAPTPRFKEVLTAQQLLHRRLLAGSDASGALQQIDNDLAYWRRALADADVLVAKMAAVTACSRALIVRSQLLQRLDKPALTATQEIAPLTAAETSMLAPLRFEMGIDYVVIHDPDRFVGEQRRLDRWLVYLLPFKPNVTFNRHQQNYEAVLQTAMLEADDLASADAALPPKLHAVTWLDRIRNGKGVWMLGLIDATDLYGKYIYRVHDLQALIVLTNLKQGLLAAGADSDAWNQLLRQSTARNPYKPDEPAQWDSERSVMKFATQPGDIDASRTPLELPLVELSRHR